jgi:hypothetical protein
MPTGSGVLVQRAANNCRLPTRTIGASLRRIRRLPQGQRIFSENWGSRTLAKCCLFNAFLIDQGITRCEELSESLIDSFLDVYFENFRTTGAYYATRTNARGMLKRLFLYLIETQAIEPPKPKPIKKPYSWILEPYLRYLCDECELSETTIQRARSQVGSFLEALRQKVGRNRFKALSAEAIEYWPDN